MTEGVIFIGAVIIAVTQAIKLLVPDRVNGIVTVLVAVAVGVLVALLDKDMGIVDITVAQGVLIALAAVGTHTTVRQIG